MFAGVSLPTLPQMLSRLARVGSAVLCAAGLIGLLATGSAAAKGLQARSSVIGGAVPDLQQASLPLW